MKTFANLVKLARQAKTEAGTALSQESLAAAVNTTKVYISNVETGRKVPSISVCLRLYESLLGDEKLRDQSLLNTWLLAWFNAFVQKEGLSESSKSAIQQALQNATDLVAEPPRKEPSSKRSLQHFPYTGEPLTIVCGDRRDLDLKTRGDIFATSVSMTDLTFLLKLGLPSDVTIKSDKLFILMDKDYLEQEFGKTNLLVIGSPAVNFLTRAINSHSVFRFNLPREAKLKEELIRTLQEPDDWDEDLPSLKELNKRKNLRPFWHFAQNPEDARLFASEDGVDDGKNEFRTKLIASLADEPTHADITRVKQWARTAIRLLEGAPAKKLMNDFRRPGLIDFADVTVHGSSTREDNDFAVISLAPNPFATSSDYVCVLVAGIHGPGTAHALRALAENDFEEHPFGGVLEIEIDQFNKLWPAKFQEATWRWQTKGYTADTLLNNLQLLTNKENRPKEFESLTDDEIKNCVEFVRKIAKASGLTST